MISKDFDGFYSILPDLDKDRVLIMASAFHYRNGARQADGSMGEIKMTPKELNNLLAYAIKKG